MEGEEKDFISIISIILFVTCYLRKIGGLLIGISIILLFFLLTKNPRNLYSRILILRRRYRAVGGSEAGDDAPRMNNVSIYFLLILFFFFYLLTSVIKLTTKQISFNTIIKKRMFVIPQLIILMGLLIMNYKNANKLLIIISLGLGIMLGLLTFSNILLDKYECKSFMNKVDGLEQSFDCSPITPE